MTYRIQGLDPAQFSHLASLSEGELARARSLREMAGSTGRYPCRVSLEDAREGEELILTHFTNHQVETPYRNAFAIYIRTQASEAANYIDTLPPVLRDRPIALRGYSEDGHLLTAELAMEDDVDSLVKAMFEEPEIAYIDAHNAKHGCFAARIDRYGETQ